MNGQAAFPFGLAARNGIHFGQVDSPADIATFEGDHPMDVQVKDVPQMRLAAITHVGPRNMIGEAFGRLAGIAGPAGLFGREGAAAVAVFVDDPDTTPAAELRSEAGVIVSADLAIPAGLSELRIPAGTYACATHRGHYAGLSDAWDRLMGQWLPGSGYRIADGASYEIYRVADHSRPDDLETDLYVAIA